MSHFRTQTGYPALRVDIAGPDAVMRGDRDYLILGNVSNQPAFWFAECSSAGDVRREWRSCEANREQARLVYRGVEPDERRGGTGGDSEQCAWGAGRDDRGDPVTLLRGTIDRGRLRCALDDAVDKFANAFLERSQSSDISETVSLLRRERFGSYEVATPAYHVGYISNYALMRIWLAQYFWVLLIVVTAFSLLLASWTMDYLAHVAAVRLQAADRPLASAEV